MAKFKTPYTPTNANHHHAALVGRVLMSLATAFYTFVPSIVDFTESHVFHPDWPPHARFHMVWLLATGALIGLFAQYCIWQRHQPRLGIRLGAALGVCVLGGFFSSAIGMHWYGGSLSDAGGADLIMGIDANLLAFCGVLATLVVGFVCALKGDLK
jgi:hypothetical protein